VQEPVLAAAAKLCVTQRGLNYSTKTKALYLAHDTSFVDVGTRTDQSSCGDIGLYEETDTCIGISVSSWDAKSLHEEH
jgi:hypothetical protein